MSILLRFQSILERGRLEDFCPVRSEEDGLFRMEDGHIGRVFVANAVSGASGKTSATINALLEMDFPAGTMIQLQNWNLPGASETIRLWETARAESVSLNPQATEIDHRIADFHRSFQTNAPLRNGKLGSERFLVLAVKIPAGAEIDKQPEEMRALDSLISQFVEGLQGAGLFFNQIRAQEYLDLLFYARNPWQRVGPQYNDDYYISAQLDVPGDRILFNRNDGLHIRSTRDGKPQRTYLSVLSVAKWPRKMGLGLMNHIIGDPNGIHNQITVPNIISTCIKYYDRADGLAMVKRRSAAVAFSTLGSTLRWMPGLAAKADGFQIILRSAEAERKRVVGVATSFLLIHPSRLRLAKARGVLLGHLGSLNLVAGAESFIAFASFWNHMPLWPSLTGAANLERHHTMTTEHATQVLPIFGDWTGTTYPGTPGYKPGSLYMTRRGQPCTYNVFSPSHSNANWVMVAQPGGGKSFAAQGMILDQLALGTRVWVIDVGRSYLKLAAAMDGEFRVFNDASNLCLNPFTNVQVIQDDLPVLSAVVATMCDPSGAMFTGERGALFRATIAEAIRSGWTSVSNNLSPEHLYRYLSAQDNEVCQILASTLFNFSKLGPYGKWFNGQNNLEMNNQFTVLELEELKRQPHLQAVVLQLLMLQISQELYTNEDRRKMVIIDESLDLVKDPMMSDFFNEAFQKYRKYGGSIGLIAQDLIRLYDSPVGGSVRANAFTAFLLEQKASSITLMQERRMFELDEYSWNEMRTLHTIKGSYSEMMVVTDLSAGVVRLVLPTDVQMLFSSDESERKSIFDALTRGEKISDIIRSRIAGIGSAAAPSDQPSDASVEGMQNAPSPTDAKANKKAAPSLIWNAGKASLGRGNAVAGIVDGGTGFTDAAPIPIPEEKRNRRWGLNWKSGAIFVAVSVVGMGLLILAVGVFQDNRPRVEAARVMPIPIPILTPTPQSMDTTKEKF